MNNTPAREEQSAMAVVFCEDKILTTVEDVFGKMATSLPKGHIEKGESHVQTAIRECFEETGIVVDMQSYIGETQSFSIHFVMPSGEQVCKTIFPVVFRVKNIVTSHITESRIKSARFVSVSEFLEICSYDNVKQVVNSAKEKFCL